VEDDGVERWTFEVLFDSLLKHIAHLQQECHNSNFGIIQLLV